LPEALPKEDARPPIVRVSVAATARRVLSALGLLLLATLPITGDQPVGNLLGTGALLLFAAAAIAGLIETRRGSAVPSLRHTPPTRRQWWYAYGALAFICVGIVQLWYIPNGSLAGGDVPPPDGVQWLPHLFQPWSWWSGSNLGGPSTPVQTPWAVVVAIVHALGGSEVLSQRIWFSVLLAAVALGGMTLARTLGLRPAFAATAGAIYALNPWMFSNASDDPPFYAAMAMVALWASVVLATADRRMSIRRGAALMLLSAPLLAYVDENPPMIVALLVGTVLAAILAVLLTGRPAVARLARLFALVVPLGMIVNAFWIAPALLQLKVVNSGGLASVSSWDWTQARATIPNGLWLNNNWAWSYSDYFPFAHWYDQFPLRVGKYAWALVAFASLLVCTSGRRRIRVTSVVALITAFIVFFSTGIRFPGSVIFNVAYGLPLGWLLREPGRFLFAAALGYGVLIGVTAECIRERLGRIRLSRGWATDRRLTLPLAAVSCLSLAALTFPLFTGEVVPVPKLTGISSRVQVPDYWVAMSDYLNHSVPPGRLLVLPVDDFYQMPYTWYYGVDQFIPNLIARETVDPVTQGYIPASHELNDAVSVLSSALIQHRWDRVQHLAQVLGIRHVLVRGDIRTDLQGRTITDPGTLATALDADPFASNVHNVGALKLYQLAAPPAVPPQVVTDTSGTPDLRVLEVLPTNSHLVQHSPLPGSALVQELPSLDHWTLTGRDLTTTVTLPADRDYSVALLDEDGAQEPFPIQQDAQVTRDQLTITSRTVGDQVILTFALRLGPSLVGNGSLFGVEWQPVGDCFDVQQGLAGFQAYPVPGAAPDHSAALRLVAPGDSACVDRRLSWTQGPVLLDLWMRPVRGGNPRICVYQIPLGTCAPQPALPQGQGWQHYRGFIQPQPGTEALALFLYADSVLSTQTITDYAELTAFSLSLAAPPAVMAAPPPTATAPTLTLSGEAYNALWSAPGTHVLVDGLTNGWLGGQPTAEPEYRATGLLLAVDLVALAIWVLSLAAFVYPGRRLSLRRPRSSRP
jgi:hypothetical protein